MNAVNGVKISFIKLTDLQHRLRVVRADGSADEVTCETRSYLIHDLLHYAVEREAGLSDGFWGRLAAGERLADLADRTGEPILALVEIEKVVGALTALTRGGAPDQVLDGIERYAETSGWSTPAWLTAGLVEAVAGRMRRLQGRWRATGYRKEMTLDWS